MTRLRPSRIASVRVASFLAAFVALAMQALFPAGFMADLSPGRHAIPIVICTAQGRIVADTGDSGAQPSKKAPAKSMAPCAFAGHGAATPPPIPQVPAERIAFTRPPAGARPLYLGADHRLAAPPPPAIGPPSLI